MMRFVIAGAVLAFAGAAVAQQAPVPANAGAPVRMTPAEISAYNASLAASDPQFIKCVRQEGPGSMVKRRVCRTNADWSQRTANATQEARDIVDKLQTSGSSNSLEPPGTVVPLNPN